jgi:hypothetical protein
VFAIVRGVRRLGLGKPGRYFGGKSVMSTLRFGHRIDRRSIGRAVMSSRSCSSVTRPWKVGMIG